MDAELLAKLERVLAARIELIPDMKISTHYVFTRDGFASLVEKRDGGFGNVGTPGLVTENGFAALLWREGEGVFVGRGFEVPATSEQVEGIRAFDRDLNEALR
ncbi:MAG TPA: hypothetical protein VFQ91_11215 [Bryobacteraceae bacterium]|nr:hypothetical protein [Bryobacteraceae bacterium]